MVSTSVTLCILLLVFLMKRFILLVFHLLSSHSSTLTHTCYRTEGTHVVLYDLDLAFVSAINFHDYQSSSVPVIPKVSHSSVSHFCTVA